MLLQEVVGFSGLLGLYRSEGTHQLAVERGVLPLLFPTSPSLFAGTPAASGSQTCKALHLRTPWSLLHPILLSNSCPVLWLCASCGHRARPQVGGQRLWHDRGVTLPVSLLPCLGPCCPLQPSQGLRCGRGPLVCPGTCSDFWVMLV